MLVSIAQLLVLCALVADKPITAASTHTSDSCGEVCHWSNSKYRLSFPTCAAITPNGKYWYLEHLGFGSSSSVIKAALVPSHARYSSRRPSLSTIDSHHIANDEHIVAIKIFDRRDTDTETEEFYFHEIVSEFEILQAAQHPNVVTGLELLQDGERFFAITEYCPESLMVNIQAGRVGIHESSRIFREILQTVAFLHSNGIAHRDLKIENIVICAKGVPKLIDFGSATYFALENGEMKFFRDVVGTEVYLAPEVVGQRIDGYRADIADIWHLGLLYVAIVLRKFPWKLATVDNENFRRFLDRPETLIDSLPNESRSIISRMLHPEPRGRATWDEILADPWLGKGAELLEYPY